MNKSAIAGILALVALLLVPGLAFSQVDPDADECSDRIWSSQKLEGLCSAICESIECNPDMDGDSSGDDGSSSKDSSDDDCDPPSQKLIDKFYEKRDPLVDPDLPCVMTDAICPCFTQEEADAVPVSAADGCFAQCASDELDGAGYLLTNIIGTFSPLNVIQVVDQGDGGSCLFVENDANPRFLPLTAEEVAGCREVIQSAQQSFGGCKPPVGNCN